VGDNTPTVSEAATAASQRGGQPQPMTTSRLQIEVVSPDGLILRDSIDEATLPGSRGELGILSGHRPLLTTLKPGALRLRRGNRDDFYAVSGGFAEIHEDRIVVIADAAEHAAKIDIQRAQKARERAEAELRESVRRDSADYQRAEAALQRAITRIHVAEKVGRSTSR